MKLDGLSLFIDTVKAGSITAAAARRGMPKSTLSRQLRQFEEKLGVSLLERSTRRMDLTEAGRTLYDNAQPFLDELADIQSSVLAFQRHPKGRLSIQMPQELFTTQMGELISEFLQRYPDISLSCTQYSGQYPSTSPDHDLQFILHDAPLPDSDWIARSLMSIPQGLYIASHCAEKMPTNLADLSHCRCILQSGETQWSFRIGNDLTVQPVSGRLVMNSPDMQLQAAVRGLGLARLARYQAELALRRGALVEVLLEGKPVAQQLTVVYRSRQLPLKTQLFLDHFQNHIGRLYSLL